MSPTPSKSADTLDRAALAVAVGKLSPLTLEQVERLFGAVSAANKVAVWRFLNMKREQQESIWTVWQHLRLGCPEARVEAVE